MLPRMKLASTFLLLAFMLSFAPAAVTVVYAADGPACDAAEFVAVVTVPDGTNFAPGTAFTKTWRLKNTGTCTWTTGYSLVFDGGEKMGGPASVNLPAAVAPGQNVDLSVNLTAPGAVGTYWGFWNIKNASGTLFGPAIAQTKFLWVNIFVTGGSIAYDFVANAVNATWSSGAGALAFPGVDGDARGFSISGSNWIFEDNIPSPSAILVSPPQNISYGYPYNYIEGRYPAFRVQPGDTFQVRVGCAYQATGCNVKFQLYYQIGSSNPKELVLPYPPLNEKWEGRTKPVVVSLDSLAAQDVMFILRVDANGSPVGDRALWGSPVIARTAPPPAASCTDRATFDWDITVPDGTTFAPGQAFTKTWRFLNSGTCTWTTAYQLAPYSDGVFYSNDKMGAPNPLAMPITVAPGQRVDISVSLTAPTISGSYLAHFKFKNDKGIAFGLDSPSIYRLGSGNQIPFWLEIKVAGTGTVYTPIARYDFFARVCDAIWSSGAGQLSCPGTDGDARGFVLKVTNPKLESGVTDSRPGILVFPQNIQDGYIQGTFPAYRVQIGDTFRSIVDCEYGATNCNVVFRLDYQIGTDPIKTLFQTNQSYDGLSYAVDVGLSSLAGQDVKFTLNVLAAGAPTGDRAVWVAPVIISAP